MKKPWLLTTRGQRAMMNLGWLASVVSIIALIGFTSLTDRSLESRQLDPKNIDYCLIENCQPIEKLAGLELIKTPQAASITEGKWFTTVELKFVNRGMLYGSRELRLSVRSKNGNIIEMAKQIVQFPEKGPMVVQFTFTGTATELNQADIYLGY